MSEERHRYRPDRVVAFSDAVFAIAITLLILPLTELNPAAEDLSQELRKLTPEILSFVIGFAVIGIYWLSHHAWFSRVRTVDDRLLRINLWLLACVVFLPFPTAVLGTRGGSVGTVFFAAAVAVTGAVFATTWAYLLRHPDLLKANTAASLRHHTLVGLVTPIVFAVSIPVVWYFPDAGKLFWILLWPASIIAGRLTPKPQVASAEARNQSELP